MREKRYVVLLLILLFSASYLCSQPKITVTKNIDLSSFLKPNQYHTLVVADSSGNLLISQRDVLEEFLIIDQEGKILGRGPEEREGTIMTVDVTVSGDPVVVFKRTSDQVILNKSPWACIIYDRLSLKKKKEFNFTPPNEKIRAISDARILRPRNEILIRGRRPDKKDDQNSLYVMDLKGKVLRSFSPCPRQFDPLKDQLKLSDTFALGPCMLAIDPLTQRIFQKFPFSELIRVFDYDGQPICEIPWATSEFSQFALLNGDIFWENFEVIRGEDGNTTQKQCPYLILRNQGNTYISRGEKVECSPEVNGVLISYDRGGNLYFLCGEDKRLLKIARLD